MDLCGGSFPESEQASSTLSLNPTHQDTTSQYSSPTISTDVVQSHHPLSSPLSIQSVPPAPPISYTIHESSLMQQTTVTSPAANSSSILQGTPSPSSLSNGSIFLPQQTFEYTSHTQETTAFALGPQQSIVSSPAPQETVNGSSSLQYANNSSSNGTINYVDIDSALQEAGFIDPESRSLAEKMPNLMEKIEGLAQQLGLPPADLVNRIFSYTSSKVY